MEIEFKGVSIPLKRTRRRGSVGLKTTPSGAVLFIPDHMSERRLRAWVTQNATWLEHQLARAEQWRHQKQRPSKEATLTLWGQVIELNYSDACLGYGHAWLAQERLNWTLGKRSQSSLELASQPLTTLLTNKKVQALVQAFYERQLNRYLFEWLPFWAERIGVQPNKVQIKTYKARWGSCDTKGRLQFNWRLAMLPAKVVEYVLIHELCHLVHFNHSSSFWSLVSSHCPNYREYRYWLREYGHDKMGITDRSAF